MKFRFISLILATVLLLGLFTGCGDVVSDIAGNVVQAAKEELENQIKLTLEKHKVDVIELKTAAGKLNDEGSDMQFFCAALVRSDSDAIPNAVAQAMDKLFEESAIQVQTGSKVESAHLVHKELTFDFTDFQEGTTYYIIYFYSSDMSIQLPDITLPNRETIQAPKRSKKRVRKPEEQISALRRIVVWLMAVVLVLVIALTGAIYLLLANSDDGNPIHLPGQNYGTSANET